MNCKPLSSNKKGSSKKPPQHSPSQGKCILGVEEDCTHGVNAQPVMPFVTSVSREIITGGVTKPENENTELEDENEFFDTTFLDTVGSKDNVGLCWSSTVAVDGLDILFKLDTGVEVSVISYGS